MDRSEYPPQTDEAKYGRNAVAIRCAATRVIQGRIPAAVRKELMAAVKANYLGRETGEIVGVDHSWEFTGFKNINGTYTRGRIVTPGTTAYPTQTFFANS